MTTRIRLLHDVNHLKYWNQPYMSNCVYLTIFFFCCAFNSALFDNWAMNWGSRSFPQRSVTQGSNGMAPRAHFLSCLGIWRRSECRFGVGTFSCFGKTTPLFTGSRSWLRGEIEKLGFCLSELFFKLGGGLKGKGILYWNGAPLKLFDRKWEIHFAICWRIFYNYFHDKESFTDKSFTPRDRDMCLSPSSE